MCERFFKVCMVEVLRFVWVWVVVVSDAGTVSHMGGRHPHL